MHARSQARTHAHHTPACDAATLQYCRLAALPATYPLNSPAGRVVASGSGARARGLLQVPSSCATQGVLCDQDSAANATILTYTGSGLSYQGTPLVQSPGSATLLLSADPACSAPGGDKLTFPPAALCEWRAGAAAAAAAAALFMCCVCLQHSTTWLAAAARALRAPLPPRVFVGLALGLPLCRWHSV